MPSVTEDLYDFVTELLRRWPAVRSQIRMDGEAPMSMVDRVRVAFPVASVEVIQATFLSSLNSEF